MTMMMRKRRRIMDIALQRIERLLELAVRDAEVEKEKRSERYVELARKIGMRHRVRIPPELKRRICKGCHGILIPGRNARVRLRGDYIATTCLRCGRQMRQPYKAGHPPSPRQNGKG